MRLSCQKHATFCLSYLAMMSKRKVKQSAVSKRIKYILTATFQTRSGFCLGIVQCGILVRQKNLWKNSRAITSIFISIAGIWRSSEDMVNRTFD